MIQVRNKAFLLLTTNCSGAYSPLSDARLTDINKYFIPKETDQQCPGIC